ncbi:hypothetical protein GCM10020331_015410 [Ectobacillus funiculus]
MGMARSFFWIGGVIGIAGLALSLLIFFEKKRGSDKGSNQAKGFNVRYAGTVIAQDFLLIYFWPTVLFFLRQCLDSYLPMH